ncbi:MAG: UxaA family hydrolase, partial [Pseudomonadota bacterium]
MQAFVRLDPADNVVTLTRPAEAGQSIAGVTARTLVPRGHKIATEAIAEGAPVRKYAQVIGYAAEAIAPGAHVHTHNLRFADTAEAYAFATDLRVAPPAARRDTFQGFRRENGSVGTRNRIAVLTSVNCSATAARRIAAAFGPDALAPYPNVDGVSAFVHGTGCGMADAGDGFEALQRVLWGYAR